MENLIEGELIKIVNTKSSPEWNDKDAQVIKVIDNNESNNTLDCLTYIIKNTYNNNLMRIRKI